MEPFFSYPGHGRQPLGRPRDPTGACRSGYGLGLQRLTGQTSCAYCGVSLVDTYAHWLLLSVDHVVPRGEAQRLGVAATLYEDAINLVQPRYRLACAGRLVASYSLTSAAASSFDRWSFSPLDCLSSL